MKRLIGILGGIASLYSIAELVTDGFWTDLSTTAIARFGLVAIAGAILLHGVRAWGGPPWAGHGKGPWGHGFGPGELSDIAKHAIDADAKGKAGQ